METVRVYTSIDQSRKLAEFLPLESADGFWNYHNYWYSEGDEWEGYEDYPRAEPYLNYTRKKNEWKEDKSDVPCWSIVSLLSVLEHPRCFQGDKPTYWFCGCFGKDGLYHEVEADSPVDACYKMIIELSKLNLL